MSTTGAKAFKENPSVKGLKQFLLANVLSNSTTLSPSRQNSASLLAELESSDGRSAADSPGLDDPAPPRDKHWTKPPGENAQNDGPRKKRNRTAHEIVVPQEEIEIGPPK